jgi:hypothetical protein
MEINTRNKVKKAPGCLASESKSVIGALGHIWLFGRINCGHSGKRPWYCEWALRKGANNE